MTPRNKVFATAATLFTLFLFAFAAAAWAKPEFKAGELIVKFKDSATPAERSAIERELGLSQVRRIDLIRAEHGRVAGSVEDAVARYKRHPQVEYIEPNYLYQTCITPNDPSFSQLWGMQNTGQTGGTPGADIRATSAWSQFTGTSNVIVAIIDTGMDYNHVDLAGNAFVNPGEIANNGVDDDGNGFIDDVRGWDFVNNDRDPIDDNGHGTHCAGTIGAVGNNGIGVVGVNWDVTLMPIKFLDAGGSGSTDAAISSIDYAVLMGARIISASWGGGGFSQALQDAIDAARQAGVLFVAAAGNSAVNTDISPHYPSSYPLDNIIAVAASDHNDQKAGFSNYGALTVDLAAPGVDILSTVPGGYGLLSGTSMATPHVAGALALILGKIPGMTAPNAKALLLSRVDPRPGLAGLVVTGGRLNAFLPIADPDDTPPGPITDLGTSGANGTHITLQWTAPGDDGAIGTANRYEIRYSTSPLNDGNFGSAMLVPQPPPPVIAGTPQSKVVPGLAFGTSYYFGIKVFDEFDNSSPLSNIATGTTLPPPEIALSPSQLSADLLTGQQSTQVLTITNTGPSELNYSIRIQASAQAAGAGVAGARIVRTFTPTGSSHSVADTPPPSYPLSTTPFAAGRNPLRGPLAAGDVRVTNVIAAGLRVLILQVGDVSEIRSALALFPDIAAIDIFDGSGQAPTLATLTPYDAVIVANNSPFRDPAGTGNALADYVDQGGGVVMTIASFINGWDIRGRFLIDGYMPYNLGSGPVGSSQLGTFDASHPIMEGVVAATGDALGQVSLSPGAELVASYVNGLPFVATKGRVSAINVFVAATGFWTGDIPLILHNAAYWSGGGASWLAVDPREGVVPAGGQLGVVVRFDANELSGGDYDASLIVESDDPDAASLAVPTHLHVTGAPNIALLGEEVVVESVQSYAVSGASTNHVLAITVPPPGDGKIDLVADGDYGNFGETATVTAEGIALGSAGQIGSDCLAAKGSFPVTAGQLATLTSDGVVQVSVQNSPAVDAFCATNRHAVQLRYSLPAQQIDFGPVLAGGSLTRRVTIRNTGSDVLHVSSIVSDHPAFVPDKASVDLLPHTDDTLTVTFQPATPASYQGTVTITSDDADQGVLTISMTGQGLAAPDIDVAPLALHADLLTGQSSSQLVVVQNPGPGELTFEVEVSGPGVRVQIQSIPVADPIDPYRVTVGAAGHGLLDAKGPLTTNAVPSGYRGVSSRAVQVPGAEVLIVQDAAPWGTSSNQQMLIGMGVPYDMIPSWSLSGTDLSRYRLVIVPSDQSTGYYATLNGLIAKLEAFVVAGGVLEVHAAGWGWQAGNAGVMTIPGGMHINPYFPGINHVLAPGHPVMAGVPNPITGFAASHAFFTSIPPNATALASDDQGRTNLVVYTLGAGTVIAGCQTFEHGFANGGDTGRILRNMIPFAYRPGPEWLSADPVSGRVPSGGSAIVTVTFDASGLNGGDYAGNVHVLSNDPDESDAVVACTMHVTGAPDIRVRGQSLMVESTQPYHAPGAVTLHHLAVPPTARGDAVLDLDVDGDYGDASEAAAVTVEGLPLGDVGRLGSDCFPVHGSFTIPAAAFQAMVADGVVDVEVRNSANVDIFCTVNQHKVKLSYAGSVSPLEFGSLFVGLCSTRQLELQNQGTDVLAINELRVDGIGFNVTPTSLTLQPGERDTVELRFCPTIAQAHPGTLTITSNDPDQGSIAIELRGTGLVPPEIDVSPAALHEDLNTGQTRSRTLTVRNLGGSDLELDIQASGPVANVAVQVSSPPASSAGRPGWSAVRAAVPVATGVAALESAPVRSDQVPDGYHVSSVPVSTMAGAKALLVQDNLPWGTMANEAVLNSNGIAFDVITSSLLAAADLSAYRLIILASDQPTLYYQRITAQIARLEAFVTVGGVLEAHAAGWGFASGDASQMILPGGLRTAQQFSSTNTVLDPSHPITAGIPSPFFGNYVSHAYFTSIPAAAEWLVADANGAPNLVVYPLGGGTVVASGQTLEFGHANGETAGLILRNLIPFSYRPGPTWLAVDPLAATVPPGGSAAITVQFDATGLAGGDYVGSVRIASNDPDEGVVAIPASMHVTGVPDVVVRGRPLSVQSEQTYPSSGGSTTHRLALEPYGASAAELQLDIDGDFGDFSETATVFVEGMRLGEVGRLQTDCSAGSGTFTLTAQQFATIAADGFADVRVQNSLEVDAFCLVNRHRVVLRYRGPGDPVEFGPLFVGNCTTRLVEVANQGNDVLVVTGMTSSVPEFTATPTAFTLAPGEAGAVSLTFCPAAVGGVTGTLTIASNDPDGDLVLALHGTGITPPEIAMATSPVSMDLMVGQHATHLLPIGNPGGSDLHVEVRLELPGSPIVAGANAAKEAGPSSPPGLDFAAVQARYGAFAAAAGSAPARVLPSPQDEHAPTGAVRAGAAPQAAAGLLPNVVAIFHDDFEGANKGWTHQATAANGIDQWEISTARANSGTKSWHVSQHAGDGADALVSPNISLAGYTDAILLFQHWYDFDDCGNVFFEPDGGLLEVREVGSGTWQQTHPYPYVLDLSCSNPLQGRPAYAHDGQPGGAFTQTGFDLSAYAGKVIQLRFHAGWDCGNCENNDGWYIDDVLLYSNASNWLSVSPTSLTIPAGGAGGVDIAFDASSLAPGRYESQLIVTSTDPDEPSVTIPVVLRVANVVANADVDPNSLNLGSHGNHVTASIELPSGHDVGAVVVQDVTLNGIPAAPLVPGVGDTDGDGVPDLTVKFDRSLVSAALEEGDEVEVRVAGDMGGSGRFLAIDHVRVIRPHVTSPVAGEIVAGGTTYTIRWNVPSGWTPDRAELTYTLDGGLTRVPIATVTRGTSCTWAVPDVSATSAHVRVELFEAGQFMAHDSNDGVFQIRLSTTDAPGPPHPTRQLLLQNVPNPFRAGSPTTVAYELPTPSAVDLTIYSASGRLVRVLVHGDRPAGRHQATWDGRDRDGRMAGPGVYFVQMKSASSRASRMMILLN
jgi:subtilisin family serine protease